jgi:hypothetical protein
LYQTQVTGLLSLALTGIRITASSCTALLVWRIVFVLIDKQSITLSQIVILNQYKVPVIPKSASPTWGTFTALAVILFWPCNFSAPVAQSSIAWIPAKQLSPTPEPVVMGNRGADVDYFDLSYSQWRLGLVINGAYFIGKDPQYAFNASMDTGTIALRRYFTPSKTILEGSRINMTVPYFDTSLRWLDGDTNYTAIDDPEMRDIVGTKILSRNDGNVAIMRDAKWDWESAGPTVQHTVNDKRLIYLKVMTLDRDNMPPNGSPLNEDTPCPSVSPKFGQLPDVKQHVFTLRADSGGVSGKDCFLIAEASIRAGVYNGVDCNISPANSTRHSATCYIPRDNSAIQPSWLTNLTLDFMSEVASYAVMLNFTSLYTELGPELYTIGMLELAYHATWSALRDEWDFPEEPPNVQRAEDVVKADVSWKRLAVWLAMNEALALAAIMVWASLKISRVAAIRDPTLAALTMDLGDLAHGQEGRGLCGAVELDKMDKERGRLRWKHEKSIEVGETGCHRRAVTLAD